MCNNWRAAKAERGIDEKGVRLRGCGDGSDSEADVGMGGSFFGVVSPTCAPQATCVHPCTSYARTHTQDDHPKAMYLACMAVLELCTQQELRRWLLHLHPSPDRLSKASLLDLIFHAASV